MVHRLQTVKLGVRNDKMVLLCFALNCTHFFVSAPE